MMESTSPDFLWGHPWTPLHHLHTLLLPDLSFQTPSLLHCSPNSLQLGCVPFLALYQVLEELPNSLILLHKFLECLFDNT